METGNLATIGIDGVQEHTELIVQSMMNYRCFSILISDNPL